MTNDDDIILHYPRNQYYSVFTLTSAIKGANCVECKLLHCEYRASKGVDYQSMPLQCIGVSGFICSEHAIWMILVSKDAGFRIDSNDSRIICISFKTKKLFKFF